MMSGVRTASCAAAVLMLLFTACAPSNTRPTPDAAASWAQHQRDTQAIRSWQVNGRFASSAFGGSGSLRWLQTDGWFDIQVRGPLGIGALVARGTQTDAEIISGGQSWRTAQPEQLFYQQTGWRLPLSRLRWWARGIPAPGVPAETILDGNSRLAQLNQDGWLIRYEEYAKFGGKILPVKFNMSSADQSVQVLIDQWANVR